MACVLTEFPLLCMLSDLKSCSHFDSWLVLPSLGSDPTFCLVAKLCPILTSFVLWPLRFSSLDVLWLLSPSLAVLAALVNLDGVSSDGKLSYFAASSDLISPLFLL